MLFFPQASVLAQSELTTHSGLQPLMGFPKYPGRQMQKQCVPRTEASALGPQGFGLQGSLGGGGAGLQPAKGSPKYSGRQVHWQLLVPCTEASALGPQGFGLQGSLGGGGAGDDRDFTSLLVLDVSLCREMEYTFMGFEGTFSSVTRCSAKAYKPVCF